jgi:hypothetical protein
VKRVSPLLKESEVSPGLKLKLVDEVLRGVDALERTL